LITTYKRLSVNDLSNFSTPVERLGKGLVKGEKESTAEKKKREKKV